MAVKGFRGLIQYLSLHAHSAPWDLTHPLGSLTYCPYNAMFTPTYDNDSYVQGSVGYDTISVGGIAVEEQVIHLASNVSWTGGSGVKNNILGLGL
jgi:Eukaryotic aspartyl protease